MEPLRERVDLEIESPKETVRGVVCQLALSDSLVERHYKKLDHAAVAALWRKLRSILNEVLDRKPDFLVLPELSVPDVIVPKLQKWSTRHNCIVIGGTHYKETPDGMVSVCPVMFPGRDVAYESEKCLISPYEKSIVAGDSVQPGAVQYQFVRTSIGNFRVIICAELLDPEMRIEDEIEDDFVFVVSCTPDAKRFHDIIAEECKNSLQGVYYCFSNLKWGNHGDGKSAVFAIVDRAYLHTASLEVSNFVPPQKIWEAKSDNDILVAEFNTREKKPPLSKSVHDKPNITLFESRSAIQSKSKEYNRGNFRAIAFDLDGTLLRNIDYSWVALWNHCGDDIQWRKHLKDFREGKLDYSDWCKTAVEFFRSKGLSRSSISEIVKEKCSLTKGFDAGMRRLRAAGFRTALISGGIDTFLDAMIPDPSSVFDHIYINQFTYTGNGLLSGVLPTRFDFEGKAAALEDLCEKEGIDTTQVIYVGDTFNDDHALRRAGHSIVYSDRQKEIFALTANHHIIDDNFEALADYIIGITNPEFLLRPAPTLED